MRERERWEIDGGRSTLTFSLRHLVVSQIRGGFARWGGELELDDDPTRSKVSVWVDLDSIYTGEPERDAHVRSPEFLDVARNPRAQFSSSSILMLEDGEAAVTGLLVLHGVTNPIELDVLRERSWTDDRGASRTAYRVRGEINRQTFGLHWNQDLDVGGIVVGDKVELSARLELVHPAAHAARPTPAPAAQPGSR